MRAWVCLGLAVMSVLAACNKVPGTVAYKARVQAVADAKNIDAAEKYAAHDLIDPNSAEFREVRIVPKHGPIGAFPDAPVVCGEINGKNRMGAYAGFQEFATTLDGAHRFMIETPDVTPQDVIDSQRRCVAELKSGSGFTSACDDEKDKYSKFQASVAVDEVYVKLCPTSPDKVTDQSKKS